MGCIYSLKWRDTQNHHCPKEGCSLESRGCWFTLHPSVTVMLFNVVANLWYWNEIICCFHNKSCWKGEGFLVCSYSNAPNFWCVHILLEVVFFFFFNSVARVSRGIKGIKVSRVSRRSSGYEFCCLDDANPSAATSVLVGHKYNYRWCWGFIPFKWLGFAFFVLFKGIMRHGKRLLSMYRMSICQDGYGLVPPQSFATPSHETISSPTRWTFWKGVYCAAHQGNQS